MENSGIVIVEDLNCKGRSAYKVATLVEEIRFILMNFPMGNKKISFGNKMELMIQREEAWRSM